MSASKKHFSSHFWFFFPVWYTLSEYSVHGSTWHCSNLTQMTERSTTVPLTESVSFLVSHEVWLKTILEQEVVGQPHSWTETDTLLSVSSFPCRWSKRCWSITVGYMSIWQTKLWNKLPKLFLKGVTVLINENSVQ